MDGFLLTLIYIVALANSLMFLGVLSAMVVLLHNMNQYVMKQNEAHDNLKKVFNPFGTRQDYGTAGRAD